jgi:membrane protease YdiL (CAAX protease family)
VITAAVEPWVREGLSELPDPARVVLLFLAAVAIAAITYAPIALFFYLQAGRRVGIALPPEWAAPDCEARAQVPPGTPFHWRSPLGLGSGLLLTMADDGIGWFAALAVAWLAFGTLEPVLDLDIQGRASAVAALVGTGLGNLGTAVLLFWLYRRLGVGIAGAGLGRPSRPVVKLVLRTAIGLFVVSILHDLLFTAVFHRQPISNVEPLLEALLGSGRRWPAAIGLALVVVGIAPVVEELVYRGVLYRAFRDRAGVGWGILGSSLGFAIAHFEPDHLLPLILIGAALAWISERTGSLRPAILVHAIYNGLSLGLYFAGRAGS